MKLLRPNILVEFSKQKYPAAHSVGADSPVTAAQNVPAPQFVGDGEADGQNTLAAGHATCVADDEPAGQ